MSNKRQLKDVYSIDEIQNLESENKKMKEEIDFIKTHCQGDIITKYQELQKEYHKSLHREYLLILRPTGLKQQLKLLEELFPRYKKAWGSENKNTVEIERIIGSFYFDLENYTKALELLEELLPRYKKALWGSENKNTLDIERVIGSCYYYLGNYTKSKELLEELFPRYTKAFGSEIPCSQYIKDIIIMCVQIIYK
mgnify:CR=1 FL=1